MSVIEKDIKDHSSDSSIITISLDAMGGDNAPNCVIKAANTVAKEIPNIRFKIYGHKDKVSSLISSYSSLKDKCQLYHAEDVIHNDEKPSNAIRKGKNSSMYMAVHSVRNKESDAIVSSGNTGALMALSKLQLQTLQGIDRPAIGGILPNEKTYSVVLDLGANVLCEAENLFEFAVMGNAFARVVLGVARPSIGLLNVGAEKNKGNETVKSALALLHESGIDLNIHGFIEGDDIAFGTTDVIVADGFSGNIALKATEGIAKFYTNTLKKELRRDPLGQMAAIFAIPAFKRIKKKMDPRNYNGAILLGLNGVVIKSHGSTDDVGFANAIKTAYKLVKNNINEQITREMVACGHILNGDNGHEEEPNLEIVNS